MMTIGKTKEGLRTADFICNDYVEMDAFEGKCKVSTDSVKNAIVFVKANNEVQIRNLSISEKEKDKKVKQETDRLKVVEVWILGTLASFKILK